MNPEIYCCAMRAHPGKENELEQLFRAHSDTLRRNGFLTDRPALVMQAKDGTIIEFGEWKAADSAHHAHEHPEVDALWTRMAEVGEFVTLSQLEEATSQHPHFKPVTLEAALV